MRHRDSDGTVFVNYIGEELTLIGSFLEGQRGNLSGPFEDAEESFPDRFFIDKIVNKQGEDVSSQYSPDDYFYLEESVFEAYSSNVN